MTATHRNQECVAGCQFSSILDAIRPSGCDLSEISRRKQKVCLVRQFYCTASGQMLLYAFCEVLDKLSFGLSLSGMPYIYLCTPAMEVIHA